MGHITELISMLGSHMKIVVIGCVEIAAAVALVSTGIARKLRKEKKPDTRSAEQLFLYEIGRSQDEGYMVVRHKDMMPVYGAGDLEGLLGVSLLQAQDDITSIRSKMKNDAAVKLILVIIFALAEVLRLSATWLMKKESERTDGEEQVRRAELIIGGYLGLWGIEAHLGWNTEETDRKIVEKIGTFRKGEYCRVCELLEKTIYGEEELEEYEKRTLNRFMKKLIVPGEKCSLKMRINLRYACFKFLGM